ncbi:hypothetical protein GCM10012290_00870 [Halolactibacillus alkaliphilus]|uniref:DUF624 domain-containing protein n=1 Tax=Halolactibacillus alkaliphilus TaxID=442899 RepID=A0A511WYK7_9BACI|nr:DUF624 domain-containing protein [Halolactibacillus alkaliphilus]GEN55588.1 hypothetical protein HAL01_00520 [Halolactibacillus alkaliphilus]GGN63871.1 hypothetical protein GCM10012290_00870 [Halolactibacillus alkaliphilus]SFO62273.1 Uncharacterized membrane protein YesL [Halolactibacillus alkaliphilus]
MNGFMQKFYEIGSWLSNVMFIHFMWLGLTFLGVGVLGVFPATFAAARTVYRMIQGESEKIHISMWQEYKRRFVKANILGYTWVLIGFTLFVDFRISEVFIQWSLVHFFLILISSIALASFLIFMTVFVRYELTGWQYFKQSLYIAIVQPMETIAVLISAVLIFYLFMFLPVLTAFFGITLVLYPILWFGHRACTAIETKKLQVSPN